MVKKLMKLLMMLTFVSALAGCGKGTVGALTGVTFEAELLEIADSYYLVKPVEGSSELKSADRITVPMLHIDPSLEPEVGDIVEIKYNGEIAESYPAQITKVYSIKVVKEMRKKGGEAVETNESNHGLPDNGAACEYPSDESQLQLIADQVSVWMGDTELTAEPYFYAVTDLDQNGRLEILQSSCQGTGCYTYTNLWEVSEDENTIVPCRFSMPEGDSQPDIITNPDAVYFDEAQGCYFYIFRDDIRNGAAERDQNLVAFSLQDGAVAIAVFGRSHSVYDSSCSRMITTYRDANGKVTDEDAYNMASDKAFVGLPAMEATIGWTDYTVSEQLVTLNREELVDILQTSWNGFSLE